MLVEVSRWSLGQTLQPGHEPLFESPVYTVEGFGHDEIFVRFSEPLRVNLFINVIKKRLFFQIPDDQ